MTAILATGGAVAWLSFLLLCIALAQGAARGDEKSARVYRARPRLFHGPAGGVSRSGSWV